MTAEQEALAIFLAAQRSSVLAIIDGLSDEQLDQTIVPSEWTPLTMVEHLAGAEWYWAGVITGEELPDPLTAGSRRIDRAIQTYRAVAQWVDEALFTTSLDTQPAVRPSVDIGIAYEAMTVRHVALHLIEETARHAGHLDIARELIDGATGLGPR